MNAIKTVGVVIKPHAANVQGVLAELLAYLDGRGWMLIKLFSLVPLANAAGAEMDQGALMRYLNELT